SGSRVGAFCGIGNPRAFFATVRSLGFIVAETKDFPDHYEYRASDLDRLDRSIPWVTTEKDWVRIAPLNDGVLPQGLVISRLAVRLEILDGRSEEFVRLVYKGL
ncbi:MAG: tetraacyldisaccharide 4'-kinase, partial [Spirochaetia bacterium]|nr:tetraacyldisaccharide 4'-kinase [Spirochaetia bacterium]